MAVSSKAFILKKLFQSFPTKNDFELVEQKLATLKNGGMSVKNICKIIIIINGVV